ncbi:MAG: ATP-dependent zinc metalloprotease FtsH [Candidatus Neomarinimicrobiota bacterium]
MAIKKPKIILKRPRTKKPVNPNKKPVDPKSNFQFKKAGKTSLIWLLIIVGAIIISGIFTNSGKKEIEVEYFQYQEYLKNGDIAKGTIIENIFHGEFKNPKNVETKYGVIENAEQFFVSLPLMDRETMEEWDEYNLEYNFKEKTTDWTSYLVNMLPWIVLIGFWIFIMRRMQGAAGGGMKNVFNFGKSRATPLTTNLPKVNFSDVAGCIEAKEELKEIIDFLKHPKRLQRLGAKIPKGVLLLGAPGTGKTLLARAVAGESAVPFFSLSGADFVEMFVGVGASRVRDLFEQGKKQAPCIIFIDELDAVGRQRGAGLGGGHDEREQTLNALLVELDGFEENANVIVMAATNRPDVLDKALLRPGRFDRQVIVDVPDYRGRLGILQVHAKKIILNKRKVDLKSLAKGTPGLVGADLANIINEAALLAARKKKKAVDMEDLEDARDKVMMGVQRKSVILSEEEKKLTAYHEAGHALVASKIEGADPVHKVSIIPRGQALGMTMQLPIDERHGYSRKYVEGRLAILLGGRAAELKIFNELTTGAGNDIEQATVIAKKMVCEWGMSDLLGPVTFGKKNEEIFLGREIQSHRDFSDVTARMIDEEIAVIIRAAQKKAHELVDKHEKILHLMADELIKYETIDGTDVKRIILGKKLIRRRNNAQPGISKTKTKRRKTAK